jgi:hypothetical protein
MPAVTAQQHLQQAAVAVMVLSVELQRLCQMQQAMAAMAQHHQLLDRQLLMQAVAVVVIVRVRQAQAVRAAAAMENYEAQQAQHQVQQTQAAAVAGGLF